MFGSKRFAKCEGFTPSHFTPQVQKTFSLFTSLIPFFFLFFLTFCLVSKKTKHLSTGVERSIRFFFFFLTFSQWLNGALDIFGYARSVFFFYFEFQDMKI